MVLQSSSCTSSSIREESKVWHRRECVARYLALQLKVSAASQYLKACLPLVDVAYGIAEIVAERGIDQGGIIGKVRHGDAAGLGIVDAGSVELITDAAAVQGYYEGE